MLKEYFGVIGLQARIYNVKGKPNLEPELEELRVSVEVRIELKHGFKRIAAAPARRLKNTMWCS